VAHGLIVTSRSWLFVGRKGARRGKGAGVAPSAGARQCGVFDGTTAETVVRQAEGPNARGANC
jgi:hypothetical protein